MAHHYLFRILVIVSCFLLEASSRPSNNESYRRTWGRRSSGVFGRRGKDFINSESDTYYYDGKSFVEGLGNRNKPDSVFTIYVKPEAHASTKKGIAIANPVSHVIVARDKSATIVHSPKAIAVVGPGGIAHAHSGTLQYLPFYGGAKGQYLEIKKDYTGTITSEKIVSEDNISNDNIVKNSDESLLSKVLAANLQNLKTLSTSMLKLHNLGRRTGGLNNNDKARFKSELSSLGETASNTIKLVEEIGDNVEVLFKSNATKLRQYPVDEEDVGEEGVGIDSAGSDQGPSGIPGLGQLEGATIADAKPIALAVIGEYGLAASRPLATAVSSHGIAIARPVATAIAGLNPTDLGITFQVNHHTRP